MKKRFFVKLRKSLSEKEYLQKTCEDLWGLFLKDWCIWIPLSFELRYYSRKQIPHNVATRRYKDKYIPWTHSIYKRLIQKQHPTFKILKISMKFCVNEDGD